MSNAFDPNGFYGEDGEEEEEEEEEGFVEQYTKFASLLHQPSNAAPRRNNEYAAPDSFAGSEPTTAGEVDAGNSQNKALTTDDLLDLFGGDSTQAESTTEESKTAEIHPADPGDAAPKVDNDDFVLPPPSDSSDDEDD